MAGGDRTAASRASIVDQSPVALPDRAVRNLPPRRARQGFMQTSPPASRAKKRQAAPPSPACECAGHCCRPCGGPGERAVGRRERQDAPPRDRRRQGAGRGPHLGGNANPPPPGGRGGRAFRLSPPPVLAEQPAAGRGGPYRQGRPRQGTGRRAGGPGQNRLVRVRQGRHGGTSRAHAQGRGNLEPM